MLANYKRHLIVGEDLFSLCLHHKLKQKWGEREVGLLCNKAIDPAAIAVLGPNPLRGQHNLAQMQELFPHLAWQLQERAPLFLKSLKWLEKSSSEMLWSEEFFLQPKIPFDLPDIYPFLGEEQFFSAINAERLPFSLQEIHPGQSDNLLEPCNFTLACQSGEQINCQFLYWGLPTEAFPKYYKGPSYATKCEFPGALYLCFDFQESVSEREETLFIPLSYSKSQGHFVGEFKKLKDGGQRAQFVTYFDPEENSGEAIARKISLLKRTLQKIFKNFGTTPFKEFVKISEHSPSLNVDDQIFDEMEKNLPNMRLIGFNAPIKKSSISVAGPSFLARGIWSVEKIELDF